MPPLKLTPGHAALICVHASMKLMAYSLCSSSPVAIARMFGSKMMSVGSKSSFSVSSLYAREQISTLRATVSAWPVSSNAITTTPAPYCWTLRAFFRKSSSPSFRLIELTTGLPCTHFSPASSTVHFELSIMIGSREISGSVAIRLRKCVIACSESSSPSSMLTSIRFAPPRTCSSATSTASPNLPSLISR